MLTHSVTGKKQPRVVSHQENGTQVMGNIKL